MVRNSGWLDGNYNITLTATSDSQLPPLISAYEIYRLIPNVISTTFSKDFDAMMAIKYHYGVLKNWNGDPCLPANYTWSGVKCSNSTGTTRIISLDLSNNNLNGSISDKFKLLTELRFLNLSGNNLNGPIPYTLCKNNGGPLVFRSESGEDMCNKIISPPPSKNKIAIISISVVVPIVVLVVLVISCLIWRRKRKPQISTYDHRNAQKPSSDAVSMKSHGDHLHNSENRQFTYKELEKFTNKFERSIGQGGFGLVYYGRLEDDTEVAVKMRSETSSHGLDEFLAEVNSLTKVHHRNLVSLVGYCWEMDHLALVYEYMSQGSLCDLLRGKRGIGETLSWGTRVRIVLESAQGMDYLHKGCSLPIIHRDVKTNNILLGQNFRAKIADFGLCKTYFNDMQTHISTNAAGSAGYMDPEYYHTGWLTESSDVYSFGVVLLEVATGEAPILPGHGHIVQRVKQKIASGNISMVADPKLGGAYDVNSMWKLIDTAMACTSDAAIRRPTMAVVVAQLKESLALEESREDNSVLGSFMSAAGAPVSTFGPSAR
ncbi:probable LRR receptor-like serine/threonine-protein kinase At1g51880 [Lolium perenne]|uniref:probable LRR receptor-like serine/threonine-protein kinase At1g51880 n=1 Tax=Lolium perenne TaxID=4522 RepID=UPI003A98D1E9